MATKNSKYTITEIDRQIDRVKDGSVVTENADKIAPIIEDNTLSTLDETSKKPVNSKAVKIAIEGEAEVTGYTVIPDKIITYDSGQLYWSDSNVVIQGIDVEGVYSLRLLFNTRVSSSSGYAGIAFYDAQGNFISGLAANPTGVLSVEERIIEVPIGAKTMATSILKEYYDEWYCYERTDGKDVNILLKGKYYVGGLSFAEGALTSTSNALTRRLSKYIKLGGSKSIMLSCEDAGVSLEYAFWYDETYKLLKSTNISKATFHYVVPDGACYMRFLISVPSDAFRDFYNIRLQARYNGLEPFELQYELPIAVKDGRINPTFVVSKPRNAALNITESNVTDAVLYGNDPLWEVYSLFLPPNYDAEGEPVRLVMYMAGSGVVGSYVPAEANKPFLDYLNAQGYAVAFVVHPYGLKSSMAMSDGVEFWGTPTNYAIYAGFYRSLTTRFNLKPEVLMFGKSHGGLQLASIPSVVGIPTLASVALSCGFSALGNLWGYNDKQRIVSMKDFGFSGMETDDAGHLIGDANVMLYEQEGVPNFGKNTNYTADRKAYILSQADKLIGLMVDSIDNVSLSTIDFINYSRDKDKEEFASLKPKKATSVPYLCYVAKDDSSIYSSTIRFQTMINGANGYCRVRLMPSGLDNPHNAATSLAPTMEVETKYGGTMTIPITAAEMLEFFQRYEL